MIFLNINGPINAGKTTIGKKLSSCLENCIFIEVDDLLSDEEQSVLGLDFWDGIELRLSRLDEIIKQYLEKGEQGIIIFSYPMSDSNCARWKKIIVPKARFLSVTLSPEKEICLQNRGARILEEWELRRITEMYEEGYHCPAQSDLIINNSALTVDETLARITSYFDLNAMDKGESQ